MYKKTRKQEALSNLQRNAIKGYTGIKTISLWTWDTSLNPRTENRLCCWRQSRGKLLGGRPLNLGNHLDSEDMRTVFFPLAYLWDGPHWNFLRHHLAWDRSGGWSKLNCRQSGPQPMRQKGYLAMNRFFQRQERTESPGDSHQYAILFRCWWWIRNKMAQVRTKCRKTDVVPRVVPKQLSIHA